MRSWSGSDPDLTAALSRGGAALRPGSPQGTPSNRGRDRYKDLEFMAARPGRARSWLERRVSMRGWWGRRVVSGAVLALLCGLGGASAQGQGAKGGPAVP